MRNVLFSTTRQWNPGDEFILAGVRRVLAALAYDHNPIIYNRHPDIRSSTGDLEMFRTSSLTGEALHNIEARLIEANVKFDFFDNSFKPRMSPAILDLAVIAGTPEWCSGRMVEFYAAVRNSGAPLLILGVGGDFDPYDPSYVEVIRKARVVTVRDAHTRDSLAAHGLAPELLPCPALLAALTQKRVAEVRRIGLIYQATAAETVMWNGCNPRAHERLLRLIETARQVGAGLEFEVVCHGVDEIALAMRDLPGLPVRYSYDSADYLDIYARYDLVVGSRVHGVGLAASLGVPGVALVHDRRGTTCEGFLAPLLYVDGDPDADAAVLGQALAEAPARSARLAAHKAETFARYREIVAGALGEGRVAYAPPPAHLAPSPAAYRADALPLLAEALNKLRYLVDADTPADAAALVALLREIRDRAVNIERKLNVTLGLE